VPGGQWEQVGQSFSNSSGELKRYLEVPSTAKMCLLPVFRYPDLKLNWPEEDLIVHGYCLYIVYPGNILCDLMSKRQWASCKNIFAFLF